MNPDPDTETDLLAAIDGWRTQMLAIQEEFAAILQEHSPTLYGATPETWQRVAELSAERIELRHAIAEATQEIHALHRRARQRETKRAQAHD